MPSNQLSRHFDSIPTLAKSQEITANRLIYANYDFGFQQDTYANINVSQKEKSKTNGLSVLKVLVIMKLELFMKTKQVDKVLY